MARRKTGLSLNVFLNSRLVGRLERATSGVTSFLYAASWLEWDKALPVSLSLPLRESRLTGSVVTAYLDNLLPDTEPIRRKIADRVHANGYDAATLLAAIGRDCVGALQFMPEGKDPGPAGNISSDPISDEEIARRLTELARAPLGITEDDEFRISIAGAQASRPACDYASFKQSIHCGPSARQRFAQHTVVDELRQRLASGARP